MLTSPAPLRRTAAKADSLSGRVAALPLRGKVDYLSPMPRPQPRPAGPATARLNPTYFIQNRLVPLGLNNDRLAVGMLDVGDATPSPCFTSLPAMTLIRWR